MTALTKTIISEILKGALNERIEQKGLLGAVLSTREFFTQERERTSDYLKALDKVEAVVFDILNKQTTIK